MYGCKVIPVHNHDEPVVDIGKMAAMQWTLRLSEAWREAKSEGRVA
jgi:hypothetical protein